MIMQVLHCPHCQGTDIIRHGKTLQGKQRYCCQGTVCNGRTFLLEYSYAGHSAEIKRQIVDMAMNASGIHRHVDDLSLDLGGVTGVAVLQQESAPVAYRPLATIALLALEGLPMADDIG